MRSNYASHDHYRTMYTAIILDEEDQAYLKSLTLVAAWDVAWERVCHHSTLHMGPMTPEEKKLAGDAYLVTVDAVGKSQLAVAYRVSHAHNCARHPFVKLDLSGITPHITLLVNRVGGGKPKDSNLIKTWEELPEPIVLKGRLMEVD